MRDIKSQSTKFTLRELVFGDVSQHGDKAEQQKAIWKRVETDIKKLHQIHNKAKDFISKAQET